jgi:hypothetical protein
MFSSRHQAPAAIYPGKEPQSPLYVGLGGLQMNREGFTEEPLAAAAALRYSD